MRQVITIGLDIAKSVFQAHGVAAAGEVVTKARRLHMVHPIHRQVKLPP